MTASGKEKTQQKVETICDCGQKYEHELTGVTNPITGKELGLPSACPACIARSDAAEKEEHSQWMISLMSEATQRRLKATGVPEPEYLTGELNLHSYAPQMVNSLTKQEMRELEAIRRIEGWMASLSPDLSRRPTKVGVFIYGDPGLGKSHFAKSAITELARLGEKRARFIEFEELLRRMRRQIDAGEGATLDEVLSEYCEVSWLAVDDLGANDKPSDFSLRTLFTLINERLKHKMPTMITSNYDHAELGKRLMPRDRDGRVLGNEKEVERVVDRIVELCHDVELVGESYRR